MTQSARDRAVAAFHLLSDGGSIEHSKADLSAIAVSALLDAAAERARAEKAELKRELAVLRQKFGQHAEKWKRREAHRHEQLTSLERKVKRLRGERAGVDTAQAGVDRDAPGVDVRVVGMPTARELEISISESTGIRDVEVLRDAVQAAQAVYADARTQAIAKAEATTLEFVDEKCDNDGTRLSMKWAIAQFSKRLLGGDAPDCGEGS